MVRRDGHGDGTGARVADGAGAGAERRRRRLGAGLAVVALLLASAGAVLGVLLVGTDGDGRRPAPPPFAGAPGTPRPAPALAALPADGSAGRPPADVAARVGAALDDPALGGPAALVVDAATGEDLLARDAERPAVPASVTKLLTAVAALHALDPGARLRTRVVDGGPGAVVLVGGGDPTLTRAPAAPGEPPAGVEEPARVDDLADQVVAARAGDPVRRVVADASLYGDGSPPGWKPSYVSSGVVGPVSALSVDAGRAEPGRRARVAEPALAAGQALADALVSRGAAQAGGVDVVAGTAPPGAPELGAVASPDVEALVTRMLRESDNDVAEALGRQVALAGGRPAAAGEAGPAVVVAAAAAGVDTTGVALADASGLSRDDRLPPRAAVGALRAAVADPRERPLLVALPVAGWDGTLVERYAVDGPRADPAAAAAAGEVRAKTGTLSGVSALAGTATTDDGRLLLFAVLADGVPPDGTLAAERALDRVAAALVGAVPG